MGKINEPQKLKTVRRIGAVFFSLLFLLHTSVNKNNY